MHGETRSEFVSPSELLATLRNPQGERAILDIREEGRFGDGHLLLASSSPLSRLELDAKRLVPNDRTSVILYDDDDGLAPIAQDRLAKLGFSNIARLDGGLPAWVAAGFEIFSGLNTPSKALGVYAQAQLGIPEIQPHELAHLKTHNADVWVIDCRPYAEYQRGCIPGAINCPGVELLTHLAALDRSETAKLVVTCAGRTRGLLGTQTLIDTGLAGNIMALRDGTMGWELAKRDLEQGAHRTLQQGPKQSGPLGKELAERIRKLLAIAVIDRETLSNWRSDPSRTTYLFDIRERSEFEQGHFAGARLVAGGQLLQNFDQHVATRGARIVLSDDDGIRASSVALWLRRMGWDDLALVLTDGQNGDLATGTELPDVPSPPDTSYVDSAELQGLLARGNVLLIDLATSRAYRGGHIPGAWFVVRSRLAKMLEKLPKAETTVLTSPDGVLAALASSDDAPFTGPVHVLKGGTNSWQRAGYPLSKSLQRLVDIADDVVLKPSELSEGREAAIRAYLSGSETLLEKLERDGTLRLASWKLE